MAGSLVTIAYIVVGLYLGLAQQLLVRPVENLDCDYRIDLVRDRLVSLIEQAPRVRIERARKGKHKFNNLLQDTQTRCSATDPELKAKIHEIRRMYNEFNDRSAAESAAIERLLDL